MGQPQRTSRLLTVGCHNGRNATKTRRGLSKEAQGSSRLRLQQGLISHASARGRPSIREMPQRNGSGIPFRVFA